MSDCDHQFIDPIADAPTFIVLDISDAITDYKKTIDSLEELAIYYPEAIADIIAIISVKNKSVQNIYDRYVQVLLEEIAMEEEVKKYMDAWRDFSISLQRLLELHNLYKNNYLFYQIKNIKGNLLILEKIVIPDINNKHVQSMRISRLVGSDSSPRSNI